MSASSSSSSTTSSSSTSNVKSNTNSTATSAASSNSFELSRKESRTVTPFSNTPFGSGLVSNEASKRRSLRPKTASYSSRGKPPSWSKSDSTTSAGNIRNTSINGDQNKFGSLSSRPLSGLSRRK